MLRCWILTACLATGCVYHPVYEGVQCDPDGRCPEGFECTRLDDQRICVEIGSLDDARDGGRDAGDAGFDAGDPGDPGGPSDDGSTNDSSDDAGDPGSDPGPICGDAQVTGGEVCDDGVNDGSYDGCMPDCLAFGPHCGDAVVNGNEVCDQGVNNGGYNGCVPGCREFGPFCGDGAINGPEECDGADLGLQSCRTVGFLSGDLMCDASCQQDSSGCWCPNYRRIVVDPGLVSSSVDLDFFPVLVTLQGDYLRHTDDGGQVLSPDGHDIVFRLSDVSGYLAHELNQYASQPDSGSLDAWVRLPTLYADRDTPFYVCFGADWAGGPTEDPAAVWSDGYVGVWHLDEGSGSASDSTANQLAGTFEGDLPALQTGIIGGAHDFDGNGDLIRVGQHPALDITQAITISAWIRPAARNQQFRLISKWYTNGVDWSYVLYAKSGEGFRLWNGSNFVQLTTWSQEIANDNWQHLVATYDGSIARVFINGFQVGEQAAVNSIAVTSNDLLFGNDGYHNHDYSGLLDEVRISHLARSPGWIATEYNNQVDPAAFCQVNP